MFLPALLSSLLFAQISVPTLPANTPDPNYPIHVQLEQMGEPVGAFTNFFGRGNILGDKPTGFDYVSDCFRQAEPIHSLDPNAYYQARWKKQDLRLEILLQEIGNTHTSRCELQVTLSRAPYNLTSQTTAPPPANQTVRPPSTNQTVRPAPPTQTARPVLVPPSSMPPPSVAATVPNPDYPLHVQLQVSRSSFSPVDGSSMEGRGNILGPPDTGLDFVSSCEQRLPLNLSMNRDPNEFYQARWTEQDARLEILLQEIGSKQTTPCELKVTLRSAPYRLFNATATAGVGFNIPAQVPPSIPAIAPNPDYPLHVQIHVTHGSFGTNGNHAEGRGNILDTPQVGFDFYDSCDQRLPMGYQPDVVYQARWKQQDKTLQILLQEVGSNRISPCDLELTIQPQPYNLFPGRPAPAIAPQ